MEQERPQTPLKCPRCDSLDTKFRYFNNNNRAQPRHYCRTCKRQWTAGGNLRDVPIGGKCRAKQTRASSSRCGNTSLFPQQPLPLQNQQYLTPMVPMLPQTFGTSMTQSVMNQPEPSSPLSSYYLNDEIFCLDPIQSFIEPEELNLSLSVGNQFAYGTADLAFMQDWDIPPMASQQVLPQQIPEQIEPYQVHDQANVEGTFNLSSHSLVPDWPMNSLPQDDINNFNVSISNPCLWNNSSGNMTTDTTTTSVNPNQWLNFPSYGPL